MKLSRWENLGNKAFIAVAVLVGISILSYFAHESSPVGIFGNLIFQYLTMPVLVFGGFIAVWDTLKAFFDRDYFTKNFNLVVFICHILWCGFLSFVTGLLCLSVIRSYLNLFSWV
jgi:hypothetical protein